jgi:hypothetical protein
MVWAIEHGGIEKKRNVSRTVTPQKAGIPKYQRFEKVE